jgi:small subunit ribosomal protein S16
MVVIRLARMGAKGETRYRIAVADQRRYAKSKFLEVIGNYNPKASGKEAKFHIDMEKAKSWMSKGAQPTDTVKHIFRLAEKA